MKNKAKAVSIIGGADGPTSVFIAGKSPGQKPLKERVRQWICRYRRKRVERAICANPHTLKEVLAYAQERYQVKEIPKTARSYREQYASAKEGLIIMHKPELLGDLADIARPDVLNEEAAREMYRQIRLRSERAAAIPDCDMPMDFHIYEIRISGGQMQMEMDFLWDIFGISDSGKKKTMKKRRKIARDLYKYYGVSQEDIRCKTRRYLSLVAALSDR